MRHIGSLGDRLLSLFVPKTVAAACAVGCSYTSSGCGPGKVRQCCTDSTCRTTCGGCFVN
ncbi:hypothetical protein I0C86_07640 [Plantactinospora sp. S1510]|uniref:Uncharacterized protein n=1 Tax=Plantactinospora alkalitolerans TaxID=2789879 RepID=A0ABS0GRM6_9ACTN|nr:hypothetical protein [Plantactinospora alkalitolerans]MBF9128857.1 hypothetical protein [Plantactinospora alkalitolerans]